MFHLIATRTIPTTLRGVREVNNRILPPPQIIISDENPRVCYNRAASILGDHRIKNEIRACLSGLMIASTDDWTYWLIEDQAGKNQSERTPTYSAV